MKNETPPTNIAAGPPLLGIILIILTIWSLINNHMTFASVTTVSLVVLSLGAAFINKKY